MKLDEKKRAVQKEAYEAWKVAERCGTVELATGMGKTFVALDAMSDLRKGSSVLFLAETTLREQDLMAQIELYKEFFDHDILANVNLEFACYQSSCKWTKKSFDLVIADEIHDSLTPVYSQFYKRNKYMGILGLSATVRSEQVYEIDGIEVSKEVLLDDIAPVCFTYDVGDGQRDGTSRALDIYFIFHRLNRDRKTIDGGSKTNPFKTTELKQYNYLNERFWQGVYSNNEWMKKSAMMQRANLLYGLPSKIDVITQLQEVIQGKTIVFGNHLPSIEKVTPNVVRSARKGEKKKERDAVNLKLRNDFDMDRIDTIGSFKMLKQGANMKDADNMIMMSYYSTFVDFVQRIGRLRKNGDKRGKVFILVTLGTQEEKWFDKMLKDVPLDEFTVHSCRDMKTCIKMLEDEKVKT